MRRMSNCAIPTQHALLVAWGEYAQQIGLTEALAQVPIRQKTRAHSPQSKLLELLVATLAGLPYLEDISRSAHPLDQDMAVAQAWGQTDWADYSWVSQTLGGLTFSNVEQIVKQLRQISQKFLAEEIERIEHQEGRLIYHGDLTGLSVSKSSQSYPNVSYGHMDDTIRLGYQAGVVSLRSPTYGGYGFRWRIIRAIRSQAPRRRRWSRRRKPKPGTDHAAEPSYWSSACNRWSRWVWRWANGSRIIRKT